jgi:hypothetical protein
MSESKVTGPGSPVCPCPCTPVCVILMLMLGLFTLAGKIRPKKDPK